MTIAPVVSCIVIPVCDPSVITGDLSLSLENGGEEIDEALLYMLTKCKHLENLDLQTCLMVTTVADVCKMQKDYVIGELQNVTSYTQCIN